MAGLVLVLGVAGWWWTVQPPTTLAQAVLTGPRSPQCLRVVVANDVSGSMGSYAVPRQQALGQFLAWAPGQLRADDEVGVIDFAGDAVWSRTPAPVGNPGSTSGLNGMAAVGGTSFGPVLDRVAGAGETPCRTWLVLLSDGQLADTPAPDLSRRVLVDAGVDELTLLVPDPDITVPKAWVDAFPSALPIHFEGTDADETALTFGQLTADMTGQELIRTG